MLSKDTANGPRLGLSLRFMIVHYAPRRPTDTTEAPFHPRSIVSLLRAYHKPPRPSALRRYSEKPRRYQIGFPHHLNSLLLSLCLIAHSAPSAIQHRMNGQRRKAFGDSGDGTIQTSFLPAMVLEPIPSRCCRRLLP